MLRPATPLAVIFLVAFVLLLLSTLSTPIIKSIPLATYDGWNYGVFGGCRADGFCLGPAVGYTADDLFKDSNIDQEDTNFSLPPNTRHSLSSLLIVHPIAAFFALVCFALAVAAHFHAPSHSPRYLLGLLILTIPTLLITLLAFLVDILFFVPHLAWGGWIVLVATILIVCSSVVVCAMRRTLVSRKARKKRIAENAEMSGANYYDALAQQRMMVADDLPRADSPPPVSDSLAMDKAGPQFAAFEMQRPDTLSLDDRTPLTSYRERDPSFRSASTGGGPRRPYAGQDVPMVPLPGRTSMDSGSGRMPPRRPSSRDQYGNPISAGEQTEDLPPPGLRHQGSQGSLGSNRSGGYGRGRGGGGGGVGYGLPPRGGFGPPRGGGYGPPRGGYGPPPSRGGFGPRGGFRGGPPPPGWTGRGRGGYGPLPGMRGRGGGPRAGPPPPGYMNDVYYGGPPPPRNGPPPITNQPLPPLHDEYAALPGVAIGQAIEMDERTGSLSGQQNPYADPYEAQDGGRFSASGAAGNVHRSDTLDVPGRMDSTGHESRTRSPTSVYSEQAYATPRAQLSLDPVARDAAELANEYTQLTLDTSGNLGALSTSPEPVSYLPAGDVQQVHRAPISPIHGSPVSPMHPSPPLTRARTTSETYYEDVDPRFATEDPQPVPSMASHNEASLPTALTPGGHGMTPISPINKQPQQNDISYRAFSLAAEDAARALPPPQLPPLPHPQPFLSEDPHGAYLEPDPDGMRSPDEGSEASHFTSVSQRGINPNWRPPPGSYSGPHQPPSAAPRRNDDLLLADNPDFSLPGLAGPGGSGGGNFRGRGGRGGMVRGGGRGGGPGPGHGRNGSSASGLTPQGRYPTDI